MQNVDTKEYMWTEKFYLTTMTVRVKFYWLNRKWVRMYSSVGAGVGVSYSNVLSDDLEDSRSYVTHTAFAPDIYASLGLFIPLIVVNCIILGRAEAFASKNGVIPSFFDGLGMGLGFTLALTILGAIRELLGTGKLFGMTLWAEDYGMLMFVLAPGAFLVLGYLIAIVNKIRKV